MVYTVISRIARATKETGLWAGKKKKKTKIWLVQKMIWKYFYQIAKSK